MLNSNTRYSPEPQYHGCLHIDPSNNKHTLTSELWHVCHSGDDLLLEGPSTNPARDVLQTKKLDDLRASTQLCVFSFVMRVLAINLRWTGMQCRFCRTSPLNQILTRTPRIPQLPYRSCEMPGTCRVCFYKRCYT